MTLGTRSKFYYGHNVTENNYYMNFSESSVEKTAQLDLGDYTATDFATELAKQMNAVGGQTYTVVFSRTTRKITISASSAFDLNITSGSAGSSIYSLAGFSGSDVTGLTSYTGNLVSGSEFKPQFWLQKYIDFDDNQSAAFSSIAKSASGNVESYSFGSEKLAEFNILLQTAISQGSGNPIENDASGVTNLRVFMEYITKKRRFEFMKDRDTESSFKKVILESTSKSKDGVAFKLDDTKLPNYFTVGKLVLREIS